MAIKHDTDQPILCLVRCNWIIKDIMDFLRLYSYKLYGDKYVEHPHVVQYNKDGTVSNRTIILLPRHVFDMLDRDYFVLSDKMTKDERSDRCRLLRKIGYPIYVERYKIYNWMFPSDDKNRNLCIFNFVRRDIAKVKSLVAERLDKLQEFNLLGEKAQLGSNGRALFINFTDGISIEVRIWCKELLTGLVELYNWRVKFV